MLVRQETAGTSLDTDLLLEVLLAFGAGDFSVRLPADWTGEAGMIADAVNGAIARADSQSQELIRIGRVVGKEGRIRQRVRMDGATGGWADSIRSVNELIEDLLRLYGHFARVITKVAQGDLGQTVPTEVDGRELAGDFAKTAQIANTMLWQLSSFSAEVTRVAREVGTEGKLGGQADVSGVSGVWRDLTDNVNSMAANLTAQVRNIAEVTTAVANGDLSRQVTVDVQGEILELKNTINVMVDQLNAFAGEVTRVAWEVGTEGKLGGQAEVPGVQGTWKELTDNVNLLADQLTEQVRGIARVVTAVAGGDLSRKVEVDVAGEILELKDTINVMVDRLNAFAGEVTRVAWEVGTEGELGGQANVPGAAGTWRELTDNVNKLAATLTNQIRAIAEVTTAVTAGDLTRSIEVEASGEVAVLKDQINQMVRTISILLDQAEEASRAKSEFLNMAAHELRTPLAVVIGYLSMMSDGSLGQPPSNWGRPVEMLNLKAAELNKIVQDLLAAARVASGSLPETRALCELTQLALEAISRARAHAQLLEADVHVDMPDEPVVVNVDAVQVGRIVDNLLTNALTYTRGRPWIRLAVRQDGDDAVLEVQDRGVGIPEDEREQIFERFYRGNDPQLSLHPGTGLGLYISRQVAQRHRGRLTVAHSEPGLGSTFALVLPTVTSELYTQLRKNSDSHSYIRNDDRLVRS